MNNRRCKLISIATLVVCLVLQTAQAQQSEDNLERHQNFSGDMLTELVDQKNWYRSIRSDYWGNSGLDSERLIEVLAMVAEQSGNTEVFDLDHQAWIEVWASVAKDAEEMAIEASNPTEKNALFTEAYVAHMIASYPHNNEDIALREMEAAVRNYLNAGNLERAGRIERIDLKVAGVNTAALLHLPEGEGPFPVVMWTGGVDVTLVEHRHHFENYFEPEGVAIITFDVPAVGLNQNIPYTVGKKTAMHDAVYEAIKNHSLLDENQVAALSSSGGGASLIGFVIENQNIKAAVARCAVINLPTELSMLPKMSVDSLATRIGATLGDLDDIAAKSAEHSLVASGLLDGSVVTDVPLLAINTHRDPVAPPEDMLMTARSSKNGQLAFFGASGHCPIEPAADEFTAHFILSRIAKE